MFGLLLTNLLQSDHLVYTKTTRQLDPTRPRTDSRVLLNFVGLRTAGKYANAVQKYCWRLNTNKIQIGFRGARNLVSLTSQL